MLFINRNYNKFNSYRAAEKPQEKLLKKKKGIKINDIFESLQNNKARILNFVIRIFKLESF